MAGTWHPGETAARIPCGQPATWVLVRSFETHEDHSGTSSDVCAECAERLAPIDGDGGRHAVPSPFVADALRAQLAAEDVALAEADATAEKIRAAGGTEKDVDAALLQEGWGEDDEDAAPGPCVTCGTQCEADGSLSVVCRCCSQAEKIETALQAFDDNDDETRLVDLLTAAMHFAGVRDPEGVDFDAALSRAFSHYVAERTGREELFAAPEHIQRAELAVTLAKWRAANPAPVSK